VSISWGSDHEAHEVHEELQLQGGTVARLRPRSPGWVNPRKLGGDWSRLGARRSSCPPWASWSLPFHWGCRVDANAQRRAKRL